MSGDLLDRITDAQRNVFASLSIVGGNTNDLFNDHCNRAKTIVHSQGGAAAASSMDALRVEWDKVFGTGCAPAVEMAIACQAMVSSLKRLGSLDLPPEVASLVHEAFSRNLDVMLNGRWDKVGSRPDPRSRRRLLKCSWLKWIPASVFYFEYSGIPRRNILLCPWQKKVALTRFLAYRMRGLSPTIYMHLMNVPSGSRFSESQSDASHRLVAAVLARQPRLKGIAVSSWYCDPAVLRISPHLSFVRELFEQNGGFLHRLGPTEDAAQKALLTSQTRRRLYEEGKYVPTDYARYWARADVLRWAGLGS